MTNYKVSMKVNGKWKSVGSLKVNQWGNLTLGMMKNDDVRKALEGTGWANFSLFEDKDKEEKQVSPEAQEGIQRLNADDEIPF